jgi:hypothetical protein
MSLRWIAFSEDDGRRIAEGANIERQIRMGCQGVENNAFHLALSTVIREYFRA